MSFIQVKCNKCSNDQIIFTRPSGNVKCLVCGDEMAKSTGGIASLSAKIVKKLD